MPDEAISSAGTTNAADPAPASSAGASLLGDGSGQGPGSKTGSPIGVGTQPICYGVLLPLTPQIGLANLSNEDEFSGVESPGERSDTAVPPPPNPHPNRRLRCVSRQLHRH